MEELGDELPDHSPRYILLSYPLTLVYPPFRIVNVEGTILRRKLALRSPIGPLRPDIPHAGHLQRGVEDAVRWRKGAHEEYGGGGQGA